MELRHLRAFVTLVEEENFGRAAARLHVTQPALSQAIQRLESNLGFTLIDRSRKGARLTEEGRTFLPDAQRALAQAEHAERAAELIRRGHQGTLAIGAVSSATYSALPRAVRQFRATAPHVHVSLTVLTTGRQIEALREGRLDVGFVRGHRRQEGIQSTTITREPVVVALPVGHRLLSRAKLRLHDLEAERLLMMNTSYAPGFSYSMLQELVREHVEVNVLSHQTDHVHTLISLVAAGMGITLVPQAATCVNLEGVVYRELGPRAPTTELRIAWATERGGTVLREFIDSTRSFFVSSDAAASRS